MATATELQRPPLPYTYDASRGKHRKEWQNSLLCATVVQDGSARRLRFTSGRRSRRRSYSRPYQTRFEAFNDRTTQSKEAKDKHHTGSSSTRPHKRISVQGPLCHAVGKAKVSHVRGLRLQRASKALPFIAGQRLHAVSVSVDDKGSLTAAQISATVDRPHPPDRIGVRDTPLASDTTSGP